MLNGGLGFLKSFIKHAIILESHCLYLYSCQTEKKAYLKHWTLFFQKQIKPIVASILLITSKHVMALNVFHSFGSVQEQRQRPSSMKHLLQSWFKVLIQAIICRISFINSEH